MRTETLSEPVSARNSSETLAERIAEIVISEFRVPWLRLEVNKKGAVRGARDVGVIIERGHKR